MLRVPLTVYASVSFYRKFYRKKGVKKVADVSDATSARRKFSSGRENLPGKQQISGKFQKNIADGLQKDCRHYT